MYETQSRQLFGSEWRLNLDISNEKPNDVHLWNEIALMAIYNVIGDDTLTGIQLIKL